MKRLTKVSLGLLALWSPVSIVVTIVWLVRSPFLASPGEVPDLSQDQLIRVVMELMLVALLNLITLICLAVTTLYFGIHILKNAKLTEGKKIAWSLINVTIGPFLMPAYWYMYVFCD